MTRTPDMRQLIDAVKLQTRHGEDEPETGLIAAPEKVKPNTPSKKKKRSENGLTVTFLEKKKDEERKESERERIDRIVPGYADMKSLSKGIVKEGEDLIRLELNDFIKAIKNIKSNLDGRELKIFYQKMEAAGFISKDKALAYCKKKGLRGLDDWIKVQNSLQRSQVGKLYTPEK